MATVETSNVEAGSDRMSLRLAPETGRFKNATSAGPADQAPGTPQAGYHSLCIPVHHLRYLARDLFGGDGFPQILSARAALIRRVAWVKRASGKVSPIARGRCRPHVLWPG